MPDSLLKVDRCSSEMLSQNVELFVTTTLERQILHLFFLLSSHAQNCRFCFGESVFYIEIYLIKNVMQIGLVDPKLCQY
jgi:hypothetical protein